MLCIWNCIICDWEWPVTSSASICYKNKLIIHEYITLNSITSIHNKNKVIENHKQTVATLAEKKRQLMHE